MRLTGRKRQPPPERPADAGKGPGPRVRKLEMEVQAMRSRIAALEHELQETRQLNKRIAEITDVVAEVLLPVEQRDDERLRAVLANYESSL